MDEQHAARLDAISREVRDLQAQDRALADEAQDIIRSEFDKAAAAMDEARMRWLINALPHVGMCAVHRAFLVDEMQPALAPAHNP